MNRVYNFAPGPSMLPEAALQQAAAEMLSYNGSGMSVMEMSHRSKAYQDIFDEAEATLRDLMHSPDSSSVLFLQGGATGQFAAIPLNLLSEGGSADYVDSGNFAHGAMVEAKKYGDIRCVGSSRDENYIRIPSWTPPNSTRRRTISTSPPTTPSSAPAIRNCPRPAPCRWWRICPPTS